MVMYRPYVPVDHVLTTTWNVNLIYYKKIMGDLNNSDKWKR